jgi:hypothetical protein
MARLNLSGFETGDQDAEGAHTYGGTYSYSTSIVRSGTYSLRVNPTTTATGFHRFCAYDAQGISQNSAMNTATIYERFYFYVATLPASGEEMIARNSDSGGSRKSELRLTSAGTLTFYDTTPTLLGTSSTALVTGRWYRIEMEVGTGASATARLYIDGVLAVESTTANLRAGNNGMAILGKLVDTSSQTIDVYYDDFAIDNAALPGEGQVAMLVPTANGATMQWTGGTGSSDYVEVAAVPRSLATYVKSTTTNDVALFAMTDLSSLFAQNALVRGIKSHQYLRLDTVGTNAHSLRLVSGATTTDSTAVATSTGGLNLFAMFSTDPNTGAAWTTAAVDAVEAGAIETTAVLTRLANVYLSVDVTLTTRPMFRGS